MTANTTRRLDAERLTRTTMKARVAQYRQRVIGCTCHHCRTVQHNTRVLQMIRDAIAAGQQVQEVNLDETALTAGDGSAVKH